MASEFKAAMEKMALLVKTGAVSSTAPKLFPSPQNGEISILPSKHHRQGYRSNLSVSVISGHLPFGTHVELGRTVLITIPCF